MKLTQYIPRVWLKQTFFLLLLSALGIFFISVSPAYSAWPFDQSKKKPQTSDIPIEEEPNDPTTQQMMNAVANDPDNADLWNALGVRYAQSEETAKAMQSFTRAVQLDSEHTEALYNLANLALQDNQPQTALALYQRVLQLEPEHEGAAVQMRRIAEALQQVQETEGGV